MPQKKSSLGDKYPNRAFKTLTMSAANTLTFEQIQFGVGLFQGVAMVLSRIEWTVHSASVQELVANTDTMHMALTNRDDLTDLVPDNQSVLVHKQVIPIVAGTAGTLLHKHLPLVSDFSAMPGGGLIIPANPIHIGMITTGFASAGVCYVVLYFTFRDLTDQEYVELIQTIMPANI